MTAQAMVAGDPNQVRAMLSVMDTVDRHLSESAVLSEASNPAAEAALRAKIRAQYEAQGVEVSDAMLDAALTARREGRYTFRPEVGARAKLALLWVRRYAVLSSLAFSIGVAGVAQFAYTAAVVWPAQRAEAQRIADAEEADRLLIESSNDASRRAAGAEVQLRAEIEAMPARIEASVSAARSARKPERISPAVRRLADEAERGLRDARASLVAVGGWTARSASDVGQARQLKADADHYLFGSGGEARGVQGGLTATKHANGSLAELGALTGSSERLEGANDQVQALGSATSKLPMVAAAYASGDKSLRDGDAKGADRASEQLVELVKTAGALADVRSRSDELVAQGRDTQPDGAGSRALESAYGAVGAALAEGKLGAARQRQAALGEIVTMLQVEGELTIMQRPKSGQERISDDDPTAKNYYALVQLLGRGGEPITLPIKNEETGATDRVSAFGVRISRADWDALKRDKKDNQIIDNALFARKKRGSIEFDFVMKPAGGYITRW